MSQAVSNTGTLEMKSRAAELIAADELSDEEIAAEIGVSARTLYRWKKNENFQKLVTEYREKLTAAMWRLPIAQKRKRVATLNKLHESALRLIEARAEKYAEDEDAAGGDTGLLVKTERTVGPVTTVEYAADTALMREIRALEEQAAKELGQWNEGAPANTTEIRMYIGVNVEDV